MDAMLELGPDEAREMDDFLWRGDLNQKAVTRHMIRLLTDELTWQGRENSQSLRGLWYSGPKQVYQTLFSEKWNDPSYADPAVRRFSQVLSEVLSEMVKEGDVTYRDLNIVDDSRDRRVAGGNEVEDDTILFVEKEAKYRQLKPLAEVFELTLVSGSGWSATALVEDLSNVLDPSERYSIYVLTDYDPSGYGIAEDFASKASTLGVPVDTVERVGIEPDQVDDYTLENERFEIPVDSEADQRWVDSHGIEDEHGIPRFGLELEAIGDRDSQAQDFRRLVADVLEPDLKKRRRRERDLNIETANVVGRGVEQLVDDLTEDLMKELKSWAVDHLAEHEAVNRLRYDREEDNVYARVDLSVRVNSGDDRIPSPLEWTTYQEAAVDPDTNDDGQVRSPRPDRGWAVINLREVLQEEMADPDGGLNPVELMGL
jgi:hypothetical protein